MGAPPGRAVERMPHPSPFSYEGRVPSKSLAGQGYTVDDAGEYVRPENPYEERGNRERFEEKLAQPLGVERFAGFNRLNTPEQAQAGDQFNRRTRKF